MKNSTLKHAAVWLGLAALSACANTPLPTLFEKKAPEPIVETYSLTHAVELRRGTSDLIDACAGTPPYSGINGQSDPLGILTINWRQEDGQSTFAWMDAPIVAQVGESPETAYSMLKRERNGYSYRCSGASVRTLLQPDSHGNTTLKYKLEVSGKETDPYARARIIGAGRVIQVTDGASTDRFALDVDGVTLLVDVTLEPTEYYHAREAARAAGNQSLTGVADTAPLPDEADTRTIDEMVEEQKN
ncbi:hypothetical protein [Thalassospira xiamenensis]|uniref:Lipoprotein n=1 Tax=Thalassospira xiamenensis TaxID=220697 RepID=A0A285TS32_9PROT|nr:hypothetical protein [Thalassospira xiamenensis]SOC26257.1 hypothetical protein SAMN05428964_10587 [Thalassospira xiamenensis]